MIDFTPHYEHYSDEHLEVVSNLPDQLNLGRKRDQHDVRDYRFEEVLGPSFLHGLVAVTSDNTLTPTILADSPKKIPDKFTRANRTGPVLDQQLTPHCVAFSGTSLKVEQERKEHKRTLKGDPDELYARCKEIDGYPNEDGTEIRVAASILKNRGEKMLDPKTQKKVVKDYPIDAYVRVTGHDQIIDALLHTGCVWFGIDVDKGIFSPMPLAEGGALIRPPDLKPVGGHAMVIVGYWLSRGWYLIKNSWGTSWGDKGYAWMPLSHFSAYPAWDAWILADHKDLKV